MNSRASDSAERQRPAPDVSEVTLRTVEHGSDGLIGWASFVIAGAVRLNHIAVRRGRNGGIFLTFPVKLLASGERSYHHFPIDRIAARALQEAVEAHLVVQADASSSPDEERQQ